ncbi:MAG: ATP-binding protein [Thermoproteota archaeon]
MAKVETKKPNLVIPIAILTITIGLLKNIVSHQIPNFFSKPLIIVASIIILSSLPVIIMLRKRQGIIRSILPGPKDDVLVAKTGSSELAMSGVVVLAEESSVPMEFDEDDFYYRSRGLITGLLKTGIPLTCITHISPRQGSDDVASAQILIVSRKVEHNRVEETARMVETDLEKIKSVYNTVFPELKLVKLGGKELSEYLKRVLIDDSLTRRLKTEDFAKIFNPHFPNRDSNILFSQGFGAYQEDRGYVNLGWIIFNGSKTTSLEIDAGKFKKHMATYGSTGSGKTTTVKHLLRELARLEYPFMVLDWHNEYRSLIEELKGKVFSLGSFSLDILNPVEAGNISEHVAIVTDIFDQVYGFTPSQSYMFREVLLQTLAEKNFRINSSDLLTGFIEALNRWSIRSFYENETKFALLRRLKPLVTGQSREIFCNRDKIIRIRDVIDERVAFELGDIIEVDIRRLVSLFILALLYEFKLKNKGDKCHFTVLEEAHNILPYRRRESPPSVAEKIFLEMRKFNESIILVSPFPSQISPEIVKSTGLKISHRICEGEESRILTDIMDLSQKEYNLLKKFPPGYGFLTLEGFQKPVFFSINVGERENPSCPDALRRN